MKKIKILVSCLCCLFFTLMNPGNGRGEIKPEIYVENCGPDYKVFKPTTEVVNCPHSSFAKPFEIKERDKEKIHKGDINLLNHLFEIKGIDFVSVEPYRVVIKKGGGFKWGDIEPQVLEILKERFGEKKDKVTVIYEAQSSK